MYKCSNILLKHICKCKYYYHLLSFFWQVKHALKAYVHQAVALQPLAITTTGVVDNLQGYVKSSIENHEK